MKQIIILILFTIMIIMPALSAKAQIIIPVGASSAYSTIQQAYNAGIPGTISNAYVIELQSDYNPSGETYPITLTGKTGASSLNTITIKPAAGVTVVITSSATSTFYLNGVKFLIIDGLSKLTIDNSNTAGNTIVFVNDAAYNTIKRAVISGVNYGQTVSSYGVVLFSTTTGTIGNSYNTITSCDITGLSQAAILIYSFGTFTTTDFENSNNTISNNNLFDNFRDVATTSLAGNVAIWLDYGNSLWTISGNSIYQTAVRTYATQIPHMGILLYPIWTSDAHLISGNFIGGSGPNCSGIMTINSSGSNITGYVAIYANGVAGLGMEISGNTVRNISITYSASTSFDNGAIISFIGYSGGEIKILNNTVSNISLINNGGAAAWFNIYQKSNQSGLSEVTTTATITGNNISAVTTVGAGTQGSGNYGVYLRATSSNSTTDSVTLIADVSNNTISGLAANGATLSTSSLVTGIRTNTTLGSGSTSVLTTIPTITGNTISDISTNSNTENPQGRASGMLLYITNGANVTSKTKVKSNTIYNIRNTNNTDVSASTAGINLVRGAFDVSKNRIYDIRNASLGTSTVNNISGILAQTLLPLNSASLFSAIHLRNKPELLKNLNILNGTELIYEETDLNDILSVPVYSPSSPVAIFQDTTNIYNNYIALGDAQNTNTQIFGIWEQASSQTTYLGVFDNSVLITGDANFNTKTTAALMRGTELLAPVTSPMIAKNNLLVNNRYNGGSHYAVYSPSMESFASNYNVFITSDAAKMGFWNASALSFAGWKINTLGDNDSYYYLSSAATNFTTNPSTVLLSDLFSNASFSSSGILDIKNTNQACWIVNEKGTQINNQVVISDDYYTNTRSTTLAGGPIDIGANEFSTSTIPPAVYQAGSIVPGGTTSYILGGFNILDITWGASFDNSILKSGGEINMSPDFLPTIVSVQKFSGEKPPEVDTAGMLSPAKLGTGYWKVSVNQQPLSPFNIRIYFGDEELGNITDPQNNLILSKYDPNTHTWTPFPRTADAGANLSSYVDWANRTVTVTGLTDFGGTSLYSDFALTDKTSPLRKMRLDLTALISGFYNGSTMVSDLITLYLKTEASPYNSVDTTVTTISTNGGAVFYSYSAYPALYTGTAINYWIVFRHRNSLETWSAAVNSFSNINGTLSYDFTTAITQAFGSNLILKGTKWCIINGDVDQDGAVGALDRSACWNDRNLIGVYATDLDGDGAVGALDRSICWNNRNATVQKPAVGPARGIKQDNKSNTGNTYDLKLDDSNEKKE